MAKTDHDEIDPVGAPNPRALDFGWLPDLLGFHVLLAHVTLLKDWRATLEKFGITRKQYTLLYLIGRNPGCSQVSLGTAVGNDRATIMAMVSRLEERGLITRVRSATDGRRQALTLTESGAALVAEADGLIRVHEARFRDQFDDAEYATFVEMLRRLAAAAPEYGAN